MKMCSPGKETIDSFSIKRKLFLIEYAFGLNKKGPNLNETVTVSFKNEVNLIENDAKLIKTATVSFKNDTNLNKSTADLINFGSKTNENEPKIFEFWTDKDGLGRTKPIIRSI